MEYTFPIWETDLERYPVGRRVAQIDRDGKAVQGLVVRVVTGNLVALVTIEVKDD